MTDQDPLIADENHETADKNHDTADKKSNGTKNKRKRSKKPSSEKSAVRSIKVKHFLTGLCSIVFLHYV